MFIFVILLVIYQQDSLFYCHTLILQQGIDFFVILIKKMFPNKIYKL
jgi:hypothetical protein